MPKKVKIKPIKSKIKILDSKKEPSELEEEISESSTEEFSNFLSKGDITPVLSSGQEIERPSEETPTAQEIQSQDSASPRYAEQRALYEGTSRAISSATAGTQETKYEDIRRIEKTSIDPTLESQETRQPTSSFQDQELSRMQQHSRPEEQKYQDSGVQSQDVKSKRRMRGGFV